MAVDARSAAFDADRAATAAPFWEEFRAAVEALPGCEHRPNTYMSMPSTLPEWMPVEFDATIALDANSNGWTDVPQYRARAMYRLLPGWKFELRCERNGSYAPVDYSHVHEFRIDKWQGVGRTYPNGGAGICFSWLRVDEMKYVIAAARAAVEAAAPSHVSAAVPAASAVSAQ